jgi:hypothetical protein
MERSVAEPSIHIISSGAPVAPFILAADPLGPHGYYRSQETKLCHERDKTVRVRERMDGSCW